MTGADKAIDGDSSTKWFDSARAPLVVQFPSSAEVEARGESSGVFLCVLLNLQLDYSDILHSPKLIISHDESLFDGSGLVIYHYYLSN